MGKTYRKDSYFKPKKHGKVFIKDKKSWKKNKPLPPLDSPEIDPPETES